MDDIKKIEFMNIYPSSRNNEYVFVAMVISSAGDRLMMYAPICKIDNMSLTSEASSGRDCWSGWYGPERRLAFGGEIFASKGEAGQDSFFTIYNLDKLGKKPIISKEEIEKVFGCKIDG